MYKKLFQQLKHDWFCINKETFHKTLVKLCRLIKEMLTSLANYELSHKFRLNYPIPLSTNKMSSSKRLYTSSEGFFYNGLLCISSNEKGRG